MRKRRLYQHGCPELRAAVEVGLISVYRAGEIAKLPATQQEAVVEQWTNRTLCRTEGAKIAAAVIRQELCRRSTGDLARIAAAIRDAIAQL
jgi:hypothetical protein